MILYISHYLYHNSQRAIQDMQWECTWNTRNVGVTAFQFLTFIDILNSPFQDSDNGNIIHVENKFI